MNLPSENQGTSSPQTTQELMNEEDPSLLLRTELKQGSKPGDVRVRLVRPSQRMFRRLEGGILEATKEAEAPRTDWERFTTGVKRTLIGAPLVTARAAHERLTKFKALAVLSSDAISSSAYATEAILLTLVASGTRNLWMTLFICLGITTLLVIVALSYRQTIPAYPNGGGSYIVAKDNLGTLPGLIAAGALMIDYVLTVSVSIAAGVQAIATLYQPIAPYVVPVDVMLVILITLVNLRGVRESATIFTLPTYLFIGSGLLLILVGIIKAFLLQHQPLFGTYGPPLVADAEPLSLFLILRSFSAGCAAITGVEAISNGIPAFKEPAPRNAAITLTWMATILCTLFVGFTVLALSYGIQAYPNGNPTVDGQIAQRIFTGPLFFMYPVFQLATLFILTLAANTSYSDFPRLSSLLARDHYLPHQFAFRGDRLAFSTGIIVLAVLAALLLVIFKGDTTLLLNLYAVGVFISFTFSQAGMVKHWWKLRAQEPHWLRSMLINGLGATATMIVALVISVTKFRDGAYIVVFLIPVLIVMFLLIHHHYTRVERERTTAVPIHPKDIHHRLIVPVDMLNQGTRQSLAYARSISPHVAAFHVNMDAAHTETLRDEWKQWQASLDPQEQVPLEVIEPTRHSIVRSVLCYIKTMRKEHPDETLTVILPEIARTSALTRLFAHPKTFRLKLALFFHPEIVVTNVPWYEQDSTTSLRPREIRHRFIVPIAELDRPSIQSLAYARSISPHVAAVHVAIDPHDVEVIREKWERLQKHLTKGEETQLVVIESPYRSLSRPLFAYIDSVLELYPDETLTVILPEFVVAHPWEIPLHNQTALQLKTALLARPRLVVTDIPQHLQNKPVA
jgi:amino acid transporter